MLINYDVNIMLPMIINLLKVTREALVTELIPETKSRFLSK